jgi:hypothetical protein
MPLQIRWHKQSFYQEKQVNPKASQGVVKIQAQILNQRLILQRRQGNLSATTQQRNNRECALIQRNYKSKPKKRKPPPTTAQQLTYSPVPS